MVEQRIRREFGETPSKVIRDLVALGYGIKAISDTLGISRQTTRKMAARFGVKFKPYKDLNQSCKARGRRPWTMKEILIAYCVDRIKDWLIQRKQ